MLITTKGRFAIMALVDLAINAISKPVSLSDIARRQNIDFGYLEQIFLKLKQAGFVKAFKGPGGGYQLNIKPEEIVIANVFAEVHEDFTMTRCNRNEHEGCASDKSRCKTHKLWTFLEDNLSEQLNGITIEDICNDTYSSQPIEHERLPIYFDYNATSPSEAFAVNAAHSIAKLPLNASSVHSYGRRGKEILENARSNILASVGANQDYRAIFTSSGTESNNLALKGLSEYKVITTTIEHPSVLSVVKQGIIPVTKSGVIDLIALGQILDKFEAGNKILVSIQFANNETGVIQPLKQITHMVHSKGFLMHTDAIQAYGKIPFSIVDIGCDLITITSHKVGGLQGASALIIKKDLNINALMQGGGQEWRYRPGTHNLPAIHAMGEIAKKLPEIQESFAKTKELRDYIQNAITAISPNSIVFGIEANRLPNTLSITMPNVPNQTQVIHFDLNGIAVSAGSACSSGSIGLPHVQLGMGYSEEDAKTAIRISLGPKNTRQEADRFLDAWKSLYYNSLTKIVRDAA